jgi:hypothetical protein
VKWTQLEERNAAVQTSHGTKKLESIWRKEMKTVQSGWIKIFDSAVSGKKKKKKRN